VDLQDDGDFGMENDVVEATTAAHAAALSASASWWNCPPSPPSPNHLHPMLTSSAGIIPQLPLPTVMGPSCGTSMGFGGFGWEAGRYADFATSM